MLKWLLFLFSSLFAVEIEFGGAPLEVEVASTSKERGLGLAGRSSLSENSGMLFVYEKPEVVRFWMKNTLIPLSIGFFDAKQTLMQVENMDVPEEGKKQRVYTSKRPVKYALEVPQGWFDRHHAKPGMKFNFTEPGK